MTGRTSAPAAPTTHDAAAADAAAVRAARARRRVSLEMAVVTGALALLTALRWVDTDRSLAIVVAQAVVPWVGAAAALVLAFAVATRRRGIAVAAAALVAVHVALLAPWWVADDPGPLEGPALTVLASNLQYGRADPQAVVDAVRDLDVDVAALTEVTAAGREALDAAGLARLLPHSVGGTRDDAGGTVIYSRHPLDGSGVAAPPELTFDAPAARVRAPGGDVVVLAAHPAPPTSPPTLWHAEIAAVVAWSARVSAATPLVVAGDLNSGSDHPVVRRFDAAGMADAHELAGAGRPATWPRQRLPGFTHLDHVLVRGLRAQAAGSLEMPGSDHAAVWARVRRAAG